MREHICLQLLVRYIYYSLTKMLYYNTHVVGRPRPTPDLFLEYKNRQFGVCEDMEPDCSEWASRGECEKNPDYMLGNCAVSCSSCVNQQEKS